MHCVSISRRGLISALLSGTGLCPICGAAGTALHEPPSEIQTAGLVVSTKVSTHLFPCRSLPVQGHFFGALYKRAQAVMLCKSYLVAVLLGEQERHGFRASSRPYVLMVLLPVALPQLR